MARLHEKFALVLFDWDGYTAVIETRKLTVDGVLSKSAKCHVIVNKKNHLVEVLDLSDSKRELNKFEDQWSLTQRSITLDKEKLERQDKYGGYLSVWPEEHESVVPVGEQPATTDREVPNVDQQATSETEPTRLRTGEKEGTNGRKIKVVHEGSGDYTTDEAVPQRSPFHTDDLVEDEVDLVVIHVEDTNKKRRSSATQTDKVVIFSNEEEFLARLKELEQSKEKISTDEKSTSTEQTTTDDNVIATENNSTEDVPAQITVEAATEKKSTEDIPAQVTVEAATEKNTTEDIPAQVTVEAATEKNTTEDIPAQVTVEAATEKNTTEDIPAQVTVEAATEKNTTEDIPAQTTVEAASEKNTTEDIPAQIIDKALSDNKVSVDNILQIVNIINNEKLEEILTIVRSLGEIRDVNNLILDGLLQTPLVRDRPIDKTTDTVQENSEYTFTMDPIEICATGGPSDMRQTTDNCQTSGGPSNICQTLGRPTDMSQTSDMRRTSGGATDMSQTSDMRRTSGGATDMSQTSDMRQTSDIISPLPMLVSAKSRQTFSLQCFKGTLVEISSFQDMVGVPLNAEVRVKASLQREALVSASSDGNFGWNIVNAIYSSDELSGRNFKGNCGKKPLSPRRRHAVEHAIVERKGQDLIYLTAAINCINTGIRNKFHRQQNKTATRLPFSQIDTNQ